MRIFTLVASKTIGRQVLRFYRRGMTRITSHFRVFPDQAEVRVSGVIKCDIAPSLGRVTSVALRCEPPCMHIVG